MSSKPPSAEEAITQAPTTDPFTYLTIVETNLSKDVLPVLCDVLQQKPDLTAKIGWDLVHLLIPLLPEAKQCLQTIARLGNPREVVSRLQLASVRDLQVSYSPCRS